MSSSTQAGTPRGSGPRPGRRRRHPWLRRIALTILGLILLGIAAFAVAYVAVPIPKPNEVATAQASIVYYADGKTELDRISDVNRQSVPLKQVPDAVQKAMLSAEDRSFYENQGISPTGIARAVWVALRGGQTQGGSTITQQYVKNYFLSQDRTLTRKLKEVVISIKIDGQLSKDQILENYLNTIYYGRGAYGVETAAKAYFGKDVSQLNASQGALLASVIRGPAYYDPRLGAQQKANAQQRWSYVMDGMVAKGWLSPTQRKAATFPATIPYQPARQASGPMGYVVNEVKKELHDKLKLTDSDIDRGGLKVVTTIDRKAQRAVEAAVKDKMPTGSGTQHLRVGVVSIKPKDGAILAMYGGKDYQKEQFSSATDATMQAGSTYKVFTLLAALQQGIGLSTTFPGYSPQYFPQFKSAGNPSGKVVNFADEQFGQIDLRTATAHSVNTVFAPLNLQAGPQNTTAAAVAAGLPGKGLQSNPANVFGTDSVRVRDMANAYATIAAQGMRATPYLVASARGGPGNLDYQAKPVTAVALDKDVTADTTDAMQQVIKQGTGQYARALGRPAAGKTGTTTDNLSAWFDGFTPQLATAVGIYNDVGGKPASMNNVPGVGELTGGTVPVQIWTEAMKGALSGERVLDFPPPANIAGSASSSSTAASSSASSSSSSSSPSSSSSSSSTPTSTPTSSTSSTPTSSTATNTTATNTTTTPTRTVPTTTSRPKSSSTSSTSRPTPPRTRTRTLAPTTAAAAAPSPQTTKSP